MDQAAGTSKHAKRHASRHASAKRLASAVGAFGYPSFFERLEGRVFLDGDTTVVDDLNAGSDNNASYLLDLAAGENTAPPPSNPPAEPAPAPTGGTVVVSDDPPAGEGQTLDGAAPDAFNPSTDPAGRTPPSGVVIRSEADFRYVLRPGDGWTGPTEQPPAVGDPAAPGYDAKAIARWDVVPYQTFDGLFHVGVVAFHINGIDRVDFSVNGGRWTAVKEMTRNPQTDVYEYTATLNASDYPDGPLEVRAIAWPTRGVPRVLDVLPLNANANGTLPSVARYVSPTGSDTTGDGSEAKPFATIMKAARAIQTANGTGNADGGTIYLTAGDYPLGPYSFGNLTSTANRWLTITPAPGVAKADVRIVGSSTTDGLRTKLVRLSNLSVTGSLQNHAGTGGQLWLDACELTGPGRAVNFSWLSGWTAAYWIDTAVSHSRDGIDGAALARNCYVHNIGSDAFSNSGMVINSTAANIDMSGTEFHPDVYQVYPSGSNRILYGVTATQNIGGQGVFAGNSVSLTDSAFVDVVINNTPTIMYAFQFGGPTSHLYIRNSAFAGSLGAYWMPNFTASNVVIEATNFSGGPGPRAGVTFRP